MSERNLIIKILRDKIKHLNELMSRLDDSPADRELHAYYRGMNNAFRESLSIID